MGLLHGLPFCALLMASRRSSVHGPVETPFLAADIAALCSGLLATPSSAADTFAPCPSGFGTCSFLRILGSLAFF